MIIDAYQFWSDYLILVFHFKPVIMSYYFCNKQFWNKLSGGNPFETNLGRLTKTTFYEHVMMLIDYKMRSRQSISQPESKMGLSANLTSMAKMCCLSKNGCKIITNASLFHYIFIFNVLTIQTARLHFPGNLRLNFLIMVYEVVMWAEQEDLLNHLWWYHYDKFRPRTYVDSLCMNASILYQVKYRR